MLVLIEPGEIQNKLHRQSTTKTVFTTKKIYFLAFFHTVTTNTNIFFKSLLPPLESIGAVLFLPGN
jgi:hypothetical protein